MFFDEVSITLEAGHGGDGCFSMRREKYIPKGGPDGGDGGRGGCVVVRCDENVSDLRQYHFKPNYKARNGEPGRGRQQHGKGGDDLILKFPVGTEFRDVESGELVAELLEHGHELVLLDGGKGGLGNIHFKSATNQTPRQPTPGEYGEEGAYKVQLKTIADIGMVGYPNAGKSSLMGCLTNAQPKTGHYAFTTRRPNIAIIEYHDYFDRLLLADIPGLVEGAHENRGMGHKFLRHVERCSVLLYVIDMEGTDGRDPVEDVAALRHELGAYQEELLDKPWAIAANKMDEPHAAENLQRMQAAYEGTEIHAISCIGETGLEELKQGLWTACKPAAD